MKSFRIRIELERRYRYYQVDEVFNDGRIERYKITGNNGYIIIESNRPFFRNKGLKNRHPNWVVFEGDVKLHFALNLMIEQIMKVIDI